MSAVNTELNLVQLAKDIHANLVFTSIHIHPNDAHMLDMIFMPILFMGEEDRQKLVAENPGLIYARMSDALPHGINGYPCFTSCGFLSQEDTQVVMGKLEAIRKAMEAI